MVLIQKEMKKQEEEDKLKMMRMEIVKREKIEQNDSKLSTAQQFSQLHLSKISDLIKNFEEDDSEEENEDYVNPYDRLIQERNSPKDNKEMNERINLTEYSLNSHDPKLLKAVKLNDTYINSDNASKLKKSNNYYKPPRNVEFNIDRNFGVSLIKNNIIDR